MSGPRQPLQNHLSGHLGGWATQWSAEEMLGDGFSLVCEESGGRFDDSQPVRLLFFFLEVEIRSRIPIPLFRPGLVHSG